MNTTRADRTTYLAAFILGALIALVLVTPARAATGAAPAACPTAGDTSS